MKKIILILSIFFTTNIWAQNIEYLSRNGVIVNSNKVVGDIYNKQIFTDVSDFTIVGGLSAVINSNKIRLSGGTNDFTKYMSFGLPNCDTKNSMEIRYTLVSGVGANGIGIGKLSTNTAFSNSLCGQFSQFPSFSGAYLNKGNFTNVQTFQDPTFTNLAAGTDLRIKFTQDDNVITLTTENVTTGYEKTIIYEDPLNSTGDLPTTNKWAIWVVGNQVVDVTSIIVNSQSQVGAQYCLIGDSKIVGYGTGDVSKTVKNLLGLQLYACGGDGTPEIESAMPYLIQYLKPKICIVAAGSNDIRFGRLPSVWQPSYLGIKTSLDANGIVNKHILTIPENSLVQTALYNYIKSIVPKIDQIDIIGSHKNTMLNGDGIHLNAIGNKNLINNLRGLGIINK